MKKLSEEIKLQILSDLNSEMSYSIISKMRNVSKSMVRKIKAEYVPHLPRRSGGRPRKLSPRDESLIIRKICSGQVDTATEAQRDMTDTHVSPSTVRRTLRRQGLVSAPKVKKPFLSRRHKRERLDFGRAHQYWTVADWQKVLFSDESKINRLCSDGRKWCWKKPGSGLSDRVVAGTFKHGGGCIMVWGCMTWQGVGYMAKIDNGLDGELYREILSTDMVNSVSFFGLQPGQFWFQQDNDPKHTAKLTKKWFEDNKINVIKWPAQSPDLNPIEHLWFHLKKELQKYPTSPSGIFELWERVQDS